MRGKTGENLLQLLELRMDNVVYRMGFAASRAEARQLVNHGHFTLNAKRADIPSMFMSVGDVVALKEKSRSSVKFQNLTERMIPKWLKFDAEGLSGTVLALPGREDVDLEVKEHLIVELYSK
jgi:small subunit ribosomal protein S4